MSPTLPPDFAGRLRDLRAAAGLSQSGLAEASGVNLRTLQQLEQGRRPNPTLDTLAALADALGVSLDRLAGRG